MLRMTGAILAMLLGTSAAAAPGVAGKWQNPAKSVTIRAAPCGDAICGTVISANAKARADAAKGGNAKLVGMQLLKEFTPTGSNSWKGKVYVPDIDKTVSGTMVLTGPKTLEVKGCVLGNVACKEQVWTRVG